MSYNTTLQSYNNRLQNILTEIQHLSIFKSNISFQNEEAKDIVINCNKPDHIVIVSDEKKNGLVHQLSAHLKTGATEIASARIANDIYLFGGWTKETLVSDIQRYNIINDSMEMLPVKLPTATSGMIAVEYKGLIYLLGGYQNTTGESASIQIFNPATYQITTANYSLPKAICACTYYFNAETGKMLITSGRIKEGTEVVPLQNIIEVDLEAGTASLLMDASLSQPVYYSAAALYGSRLYHFGGKINEETKVGTIQWLDINTFEKGICNTAMPMGTVAAQAITYDDFICVIGGHAGAATQKIRIFDPVADDGIPYYKKDTQKTPWTATYTTAQLVGNTIYIFGGAGSSEEISGRMTPYCFTLYKKNTCVIKISSEAPEGRTLIQSKDAVSSIYGCIEQIILHTDSSTEMISWTENGVIHTSENISGKQFNLGATQQKKQGYIYSPEFTNIKEVVVSDIIPRDVQYIDTGARLTNQEGLQCAIAHGDNVYVFGGWYPISGNSSGDVTDAIVKFNTKDNSLTTVGKMPTTCSGSVGAKVGDKLYVIGGYKINNLIYCFDPSTNTLSTCDLKLPKQIYNAAVAQWGDDIYVLGGRSNNGGSSGVVPISDITYVNINAKVSYTTNIKLPIPVYQCGYAQYGDRAYIISGTQADKSYSTAIQYFDRSTMTTGILLESSHKWGDAPVSYATENHLYIAGYYNGVPYFERINVKTLEVEDLTYKVPKGLCIAASAKIDDTLYTFGGVRLSGFYPHAVSKLVFSPVVPENCVLFHVDNKGTQCAPYISNGTTAEVNIDKIYKGTTAGYAQQIVGATVYNNNKWNLIK